MVADSVADFHTPTGRQLIVIDTSYILSDIFARGLQHSVTCRDLDGFFDQVWTVNPIATAAYPHGQEGRRKAAAVRLDARNAFVEGTHLAPWPMGEWPLGSAAGFVVSQAVLLMRLVALSRRNPKTVVRAGDPLYAGLFGLVLARLAGRPLLVRVGGNFDAIADETGKPVMERLFRTRRVERFVQHLVLRSANVVAGANEENLTWATDIAGDPSKGVLFRYGNLIDPVHFVPPRERGDADDLLTSWGVEPGVNLLVYVGRLEKIKRPHELIEVAAQLATQGLESCLVLIGEGSERAHLQALAGEAGLTEAVRFVGAQDQRTLARILARADVVLSPHTGRALVEATLAGAPVVAYDVDWQSEIIEDRVTGLLVPHGAVQAMVEAVKSLLMDREFAARLGASAMRRSREMFDPQALNDIERKTYTKLLESRTWKVRSMRRKRIKGYRG